MVSVDVVRTEKSILLIQLILSKLDMLGFIEDYGQDLQDLGRSMSCGDIYTC